MHHPEWRLIISGHLPGPLNMAYDEALLEAVAAGASPPVVRFYLWDRPTVSLGYAQNFLTAVNPQFCREHWLPVVRRITGGRAVIHDQELTYAVISPEKNSVFPGGIQRNYAVIAELLKEAIEHFGISVEMTAGKRGEVGGGTRDFRYNACFNSTSIHELTAVGCKITGSAQLRRQGCFLQHGSIPVDMDLDLAVQALSPGCIESVEQGKQALARKVGWLNRFSAIPVEIPALREAIIIAFQRRLADAIVPSVFTVDERRRARRLRISKYGYSAWTSGRKTMPEDNSAAKPI